MREGLTRLPAAIRAPMALLLLALAAELGLVALGHRDQETDLAWFRVAAQAGSSGALLVLLAAALGAVVGPRLLTGSGPRAWLLLFLGALIARLPWVDLAQIQPDTVNYFVLAQELRADPLGQLAAWPEAVWGAEQARFHRLMPGGPALYALGFAAVGEGTLAVDLVLSGVFVGLSLGLAALSRGLGAPSLAAGWAILAMPYLAAQSSWMLVDLPLCLALVGAWTVVLLPGSGRLGRLASLAGVSGAGALAALLTKVAAPLFLLGPAAAAALRPWRDEPWRRRGFVGLGLLGLAGLLLVSPPRLRESPLSWLDGALGMVLHTRPALWVLALPAVLALRGRGGVLAASLLATAPVLVLYSAPHHTQRYALPLALGLALGAAPRLARHPRVLGALVASGLALGLAGYRPNAVHNQGENLRRAVSLAEEAGARRILVVAQHPDTSFPGGALTALVDLYTELPALHAGDLALAEPGRKRHWWESYEAPARHRLEGEPAEALEPGDVVLISVFSDRRDAADPPWAEDLPELGRVSDYRASSWLLPREVRLRGPAATAGDR